MCLDDHRPTPGRQINGMSEGRMRGENITKQVKKGLSEVFIMNDENFSETIKDNKAERGNKQKILIILSSVLGGLIILSVLFYFLWLRPILKKSISEPLAQPLNVSGTNTTTEAIKVSDPNDDELLAFSLAPGLLRADTQSFIPPTPQPGEKPVCGKDTDWIVLLIGVDYRGDGYRFGLADVIRVARIDFVNMTVNMVALPRDLIVEAPEGRFTEVDPYKINQAYLFGTPGWDGYLGSGQGAGALAEVIEYNFGIPIDHYGVINFDTFINFIDAIDGIEVNLFQEVEGGLLGDFPAGPQTLDGRRALALARIRWGYGDAFRVVNQTQIMRGVLNKLTKPAYLIRVPSLIDQYKETFLTDLSIQELGTIGSCFLRNFSSDNLKNFEAPPELLTSGRVYIPTLNGNAFVYHWDHQFVDWMYESLLK